MLAEIHHADVIVIQGKTIQRAAARAVILCKHDLLMVYSSVAGDYKFPGGGVEAGESHEQALRREIREECGAYLAEFGRPVGSVIEYNVSKEAAYDVFKMTSYYYWCRAGDGFGTQKLDAYEKDLGFEPVWINIDKAILANRSLLNSDKAPNWLKREVFVLEYIRNKSPAY